MEILNVGTTANDHTGDKGRDAFVKIKGSLAELNGRVPLANKFEGITDDYELTGWVPATGVFHLERITIKNDTTQVGQLSAGTQAGANDIFSQRIINSMGGPETVNPEGWTTIPTDLVVSGGSTGSIFFNHAQDGDTWNLMSLTIYLVLRQIA